MLGYLKAFGVFLLWACIALSAHHFITNGMLNGCFESSENESQTIALDIRASKFYLTDYRSDTLMSFDTGFMISKNSPQVKNTAIIIDSLSQLLLNNYTQKITIQGKYGADENSDYSGNLGIERASKVFEYFSNNGVANTQLEKVSVIEHALFEYDSTNNNGIALVLSTLNPEEIDNIEKSIEVRRLYLDFTNEILEPTNTLNKYVAYLNNYLKRYPTKKIYITGHTANAGYYQKNLEIGLQRATQVMEFFKSKGIVESVMIAESKGESEPIAKKGSTEGKRLNKRIEILIK